MKPLLVGELNPYGPAAEYALWPDPPGCAGHRLCHKVLGMSEHAYMEAFDRTNLCGRKWSMPLARLAAGAVNAHGQPRRVIIMLGRKVATAFGYGHHQPFTTVAKVWNKDGYDLMLDDEVTADNPTTRFLVLPHPSGLCRVWNEPGAFERARSLIVRYL